MPYVIQFFLSLLFRSTIDSALANATKSLNQLQAASDNHTNASNILKARSAAMIDKAMSINELANDHDDAAARAARVAGKINDLLA